MKRRMGREQLRVPTYSQALPQCIEPSPKPTERTDACNGHEPNRFAHTHTRCLLPRVFNLSAPHTGGTTAVTKERKITQSTHTLHFIPPALLGSLDKQRLPSERHSTRRSIHAPTHQTRGKLFSPKSESNHSIIKPAPTLENYARRTLTS